MVFDGPSSGRDGIMDGVGAPAAVAKLNAPVQRVVPAGEARLAAAVLELLLLVGLLVAGLVVVELPELLVVELVVAAGEGAAL